MEGESSMPFASVAPSKISFCTFGPVQVCKKLYLMDLVENKDKKISIEAILEEDSSNQNSISAKKNKGMTVNIKGVDYAIGHNIDANSDPKRIKRIMSNRLSAQRCRDKQNQYISELEQKVKDLKDEIVAKSTNLSRFQQQCQFLQMEKESLIQELAWFATKNQLLDVQIERAKEELKRLREIDASMKQYRQLQHEMLVMMNLGATTGLQQMLPNPSLSQFGEFCDVWNLDQGDIPWMNMMEEKYEEVHEIQKQTWNKMLAHLPKSAERSPMLPNHMNIIITNEMSSNHNLNSDLEKEGIDHHALKTQVHFNASSNFSSP